MLLGAAVVFCLAAASPAWAAHDGAAAGSDSQDLAKKLSNPISDLVSVPFQFNWENGVGSPDRTRFILNIQPVMPFALNDKLNLVVRIAFNPNVSTAWFTSVMGIINSITMLAIILAGAAVVREREHGTMEHLLVMPLTPLEIAMAKIWANSVVITVAAGLSLYFVVGTVLGVPIAGSIPLFMLGVMIYLFFATAIGIFLATIARSMPQLGLLFMLVFLPMNMLSGSNTPLESMPPWLATVMQASPSTHFVAFAQAILYRGAGLAVVWPQFLIVALIGGLFLGLALLRFRRAVAAIV